MGGQKPAISVDPNTVSLMGRVREAVRSLKSEMKGLADQAERYARAMGQKTAGGRPPNFPEAVTREQHADRFGRFGPPPGPGSPGTPGTPGSPGRRGGLSTGEELLLLAPQLSRIIGNQIGAVLERERVTNYLGFAQTGQWSGGTGARQWQRMLRSYSGYASTADLYAGAERLGGAGLLAAPNDPRTRDVMRSTQLASRITQTNFTTGADIVAGFRDPQIVNALRQGMVGGRSITTPFAGGGIQLFGQAGPGGFQPGLMEQIYGGLGGGRRGEDFYRTGLASGGGLLRLQSATGMSDEQMKLIQRYGIARAERRAAHPEETEAQAAVAVQKDLQKDFKDTGENLKRFRESVSDLVDVLTTSLVPVINGLTTFLKPFANGMRWAAEHIPGFNQALAAMITALITATAVIKVNTLLGGRGFMGGLRGVEGAGEAGALSRAGAGGGALWGKLGSALGSGGVALGAGATLATTAAMLAGGLGGSWAGRKIGGKGTGGKIGSVLGGAAGGALTGAALGAFVGGPFAPLTAGVGAIAGGLIGGVAGLFGDAWPVWMREGVGDAAEIPAGGPASGKDLRGAKSSDSNMNPEFAKKLQKMFAENPSLSLTSGWRDPATQARLYREKPGLAAPPGHSNHEKGLAADLGPPSEYPWIAANASKYGIFLPMPNTNERKAKGKKVEPWHVEPSGAMTAGVPATPTTASTPTSPTKTKAAAAKPVSPEMKKATSVSPGAGAYQEATSAASVLGGPQIGDAWEGDNTVVFPGTSGGGVQTNNIRGGSITIGRIEIHVSIARATPEEADRFARSVGSLLGDRERMLALARGGSG